jgi:hypothetical protein
MFSENVGLIFTRKLGEWLSIIMQDGVNTKGIRPGCRRKIEEICAPLGYPRILDP